MDTYINMADFSTILNPLNDTLDLYCHSIHTGGGGGAVSITGVDGVVVTPDPLVNIGTIGLVATLQEDDVLENIALGNFSLDSNTTGFQNLAFGQNALRLNTTGNSNLAIGFESLGGMVSGEQNVAVGYGTLGNDSIGNYNVAIGSNAGRNLTDFDANTFVGTGAGASLGDYRGCTLIGFQADTGNNGIENSTAIGIEAFVNVSNAIVLGTPGQKLGVGLPIPLSDLSFSGQSQQSIAGTAHGSITDVKKTAVTGSFTAEAGEGTNIIYSFPFDNGTDAVAMVTNFVNASVVFQINNGGTILGGTVTTSMGIARSIPAAYYTLLADGPEGGVTLTSEIQNIQQCLFSEPPNTIISMHWVVNAGALELHAVFAAAYDVKYMISYERFGIQE